MEEEKTPLPQRFFGEHTRLENHNNSPSDGTGFQSSSKCKSKIGLFVSFLALSASLEILLTSSLGKNAFPGGDSVVVVNEFLTNTLNSSYKHFTNGTVIGMIGFLLSLVVLAYFLRRIYPKNTEKVDPIQACRPKNAFSLSRPALKTVQELYRCEGINPDYWTYAGVPEDSGGRLYLGIPFEQYKNISWEEALEKELQIHAPQYKGFHDYMIVPVKYCKNLSLFNANNSNGADHDNERRI